MEKYSRDKSTLSRTLPYYAFKNDFTTVNYYYWGAGSALHAVAGRVRHMNSSEDFHRELGLTQQTYVKPLGNTPAEYADVLNVSTRWHRLLTLVILAAAFERYLTAVATIAISSDPALTPGFPKKIDGLTLAKYELQAGDRPTQLLTKGEWSARLAAFRKYFRLVPAKLLENEPLETMRKKRNQIAHEFGLDDSAMSVHAAILLGSRRSEISNSNLVSLGEPTLKKWLAVIDSSATAIDEYLLSNFIGGHELPAIYIEWTKSDDGLFSATGIRPDGTESK